MTTQEEELKASCLVVSMGWYELLSEIQFYKYEFWDLIYPLREREQQEKGDDIQ